MFGRTVARVVMAVIAALSVLLVTGQSVSAHIDFESSTPADGEVIEAPVSEIIIRFTGQATPVGDEFTVLHPSGTVREPDSVSTVDGTEFVLGFDPPLAGGAVGVRWVVAAPDTHPIDGSFSFSVTAPAPTTVPVTAAPTTESATTEPAATDTASSTVPPTTAAAVVEEATDVADDGGDAGVVADAAEASPPPGDAATTVSLEEFLAADAGLAGETRQLTGRVIGFLGVVLAVGVLAFLGTAFRGVRSELSVGVMAVAGAGVAALVGAAIEYSGWVAQSGGSLLGELTTSPGSAAALRMLGGFVVAVAALLALRSLPVAERVVARSLSASVIDQTAEEATAAPAGPERLRRWNVRSAPGVVVGAALLIVSFSFDGHTVSKGQRVVHALVNVVHVAAGAIWVGGVAALAALLIIRRRRGTPDRAASLIVRFSGIATVALAAVAAAGVLMAWIVLESFDELTGSEWGKILLLKTAAVGLAALGGAYNHFRLRPRLEANADDPALEAEFRSSLIAEGLVLLFVVVTTAWLVAASTSA